MNARVLLSFRCERSKYDRTQYSRKRSHRK